MNATRPAALLLAALLLAAGCSDDNANPFTTTTIPGATTTTTAEADASGIGDPYFPDLGNPGYDVEHYLIDLDVDPTANTLAGEVVITAAATSDLDTFHLDLLGLTVDGVTVDGTAAPFRRDGAELVIDPAALLPAGEGFAVAVAYHGTPEVLYTLGFPLGWVHDGNLTYVVSEPDAAHTWFPCNDHLSDKAAFTFRITAPEGSIVAANGTLAEVLPADGAATYVWEMPRPMATYLATVVVGDLVRVDAAAPGGVPLRDYLPADMADAAAMFERVGDMLDYYSSVFGPYPFAEYGHAVVPGVPGALEDQTLCIMGRERLEAFAQGESPMPIDLDQLLSHELSHQWFGDSVTPATWNDIWLNEGFATFAMWLWVEHDRGRAAYEDAIRGSYYWLGSEPMPVPGNPGASGEEMLHDSVYLRGGLTLHALRAEVGDDLILQILREWADRYAYGNATTADFIALAEELSGRDLDALFDAWLFDPTIPALPE